MDSKILFHESTFLVIKADKNVNWDLVKLTTPVGVNIFDGEFVASVYNTTDSEFVGMLSSKVLVNDCIEVSAIKDGFVYGLEIEGMSVGDKIIAGNGVFIKAVGDNSIAEVIEVRENNYCLVRGLRTQAGGGGGGAVNSVNGMDGDVVISAKNLNANIVGNPALLQSEYNSGIYEAVRDANNKAAAVENELYTKQNKLIADASIEIVDNKINEKVIVLPISVSGASIVEIANATATVIGRLLKLEASLGFSNTLTGRFQLNLIIDNVPSFVLADGLVSVSALNLNNMTMSALVANVSRSSSQMTVMIQIDNISVYSRGMRIIQII